MLRISFKDGPVTLLRHVSVHADAVSATPADLFSEAVCDQLSFGEVVEPVELPAAVLRLVEVGEAGNTPLQL